MVQEVFLPLSPPPARQGVGRMVGQTASCALAAAEARRSKALGLLVVRFECT